jgi:hypothetical protein
MPKAFPLFCAIAFLCLCIAALKIREFLPAFPQNGWFAILRLGVALIPLWLVFATSIGAAAGSFRKKSRLGAEVGCLTGLAAILIAWLVLGIILGRPG